MNKKILVTDGFETKQTNTLSFGSQKVLLTSPGAFDIEELRKKCEHLLPRERMKFAVSNKSDRKVIAKILPKDTGFQITDAHDVKLEDLNVQLSFRFV